METNNGLKLSNNVMNVNNSLSSIFSACSKNDKNSKDIRESELNNHTLSNSSDIKKISNFQNASENQKQDNKNNKSSEKGLIIITLIIIIGIIILIAALIGVFFTIISQTTADFNIATIEKTVKEFFVKIFYSIAKWILCFVDIIFSYIKNLCGLNMDYTSISGIFAPESDMVFNLLITAEERATAILRNLIVITIIAIVIFTIIALVKSQFEAMRKSKPTSVMETIKKTIRAFVLLLITPFLAICGIVFSDLVLQTLFRATNTSGAMTLGSQIFASASVSSNAYRTYAQNNARIPIVCDFTKEDEILLYYQENPVNETFTEYLMSTNNLKYVTYLSFVNENFMTFTELNQILDSSKEEYKESAYYGIYDIKVEDSSDSLSKYRRIESYAEEYYVMADVIDFEINTGNVLYIKTIEEVLDSIVKIPDEELRRNTFDLIIKQYGIKFYLDADMTNEITEDGLEFISVEKYQNKSLWNIISYTSYYISPDENGEPTYSMQIPYVHLKGQIDEIEGAKFIMAVEKETEIDGISYTYYEPLTIGYSNRYNKSFESEYIREGQIIAAKGTFKDSQYPTAIRETADADGNLRISFYRENIESVAVGFANELFQANFSTGSGIQKLLKMIQAFFNPESVVGDISTNFDAIQFTQDTEESIYSNLQSGRIKLSYFFQFEPSETAYRDGAGTLSFRELFIPSTFNILLIVVAPILLAKICLVAFFGLIQRSFELFLIILTYPAACATIPIDDRAYNGWWREYFQRLFATYGIILGLNFVFMLFPIITTIQYFKPSDIATNKVMYKVCTLFFSSLTINQLTNMLNATTAILFELVAFTLLETAPTMVNQMIGTTDPKSNFMEGVKKILINVGRVTKVIGKVVGGIVGFIISPNSAMRSNVRKGINKSEKAIKNLNNLRNFKRKLIPGSAFIDQVAKDRTDSQKAKETKEAMKNFKTSSTYDPPEVGEEPKAPEKPNLEGKSEEEKKKLEEQYEADRKKYENDKAKYDKEKKEKDEYDKKWKEQGGPFADLIKAQKEELASLQSSANDMRNKQADDRRDKRLGLMEGNDSDNEEDEDGKPTSNKKDDGDEESQEDEHGLSSKFDSFTGRQLRKEKRKAGRQYKKIDKRRKILEKRLKWQKRHGGSSDEIDRIENAISGATGEAQKMKARYEDIQNERMDRKNFKKTVSDAEYQAKKAEWKGNSKARKKLAGQTFTGRIKRGVKFVGSHTIGAGINHVKNKHRQRIERRDERRERAFKNVYGNIFQKAGNKAYRSYINHKQNKRFKKSQKKINKYNEKLKYVEAGSKKQLKYQNRIDKWTKEQTKVNENQQKYIAQREKALINKETVKNKERMKKDDDVAGIRNAGFVKRLGRQIRHPVKAVKSRVRDAIFSQENIIAQSNRKDEVSAQINDLEAKLKQMTNVDNVKAFKEKSKMQKQLADLRIEKSKLEEQLSRYDSYVTHNSDKDYYKEHIAFKKKQADQQRHERTGIYVKEEEERKAKEKEEEEKRKRLGITSDKDKKDSTTGTTTDKK